MSGPHGWSEGGLCARSPPPPPRAPRACASPLGSCPRRFSADFGWDDVEVRQKLWSELRQGRTLGASREAPRRCGGDSGKVNRSLPGAHRAERCPVGAADLGHRRGRRLVCVLDLLFLLLLFDLAVRSEGDDGGDARVLLPHRAHVSGVSAGPIHSSARTIVAWFSAAQNLSSKATFSSLYARSRWTCRSPDPFGSLDRARSRVFARRFKPTRSLLAAKG